MATRTVGLMKLEDPEFLSLVKTPANQTGFKIIRSKQEDNDMSHKDRNLRVRTKQKRTDGLLFIDFPAGISSEDAAELMDSFGLGDDYELATDAIGDYYAKRTGDEYADVPTVAIDLGNGFVANIATASMESRSDSQVSGVTLVGLEFDETFENVESVKRWMEERDINFKSGGVETLEGGTAVIRHDTTESTEVRKVRLGEGVTGLVSKTKDNDVPIKVYRSVIEQSYGNWGWGHLNFATALADPAFTDASWDAIYVLRDVLENVIIYSGLPLDDRKTLVQNVCEQFTQYMSSLIDSLPREVIEKARADRNQKQEPTDMAINDREGNSKKVERKDKDSEESADAKTEEKDVTREDDESTNKDKDTEGKTKDKQDEFVTRADMEFTVTAAVAAAMNPEEDKTQRSDEEDKEAGASNADENSDAGMPATLVTMATAITALGEGMTAITRSVDTVKKDIEELNGSTVARSDEDDVDADEEDADSVKAKRDDANPFYGMFGDRFDK